LCRYICKSGMVFFTALLSLLYRHDVCSEHFAWNLWSFGMFLLIMLSWLYYGVLQSESDTKVLDEMRASGLEDTISIFAHVNGKLCVEEGAMSSSWSLEQNRRAGSGAGSGSDTNDQISRKNNNALQSGWLSQIKRAKSPAQLGELLLKFENHILMERMNKQFITQRLIHWRNEVSTSRNFDELNELCLELIGQLRMPPYVTLIQKIVKKILKVKKSTRFAASLITEYVVGESKARTMNIIHFNQVLLSPDISHNYNKNNNHGDKVVAPLEAYVSKSQGLMNDYYAQRFVGQSFNYINTATDNRRSGRSRDEVCQAVVVECLSSNCVRIRIEGIEKTKDVPRRCVFLPIKY